jgi:hypothetical protein
MKHNCLRMAVMQHEEEVLAPHTRSTVKARRAGELRTRALADVRTFHVHSSKARTGMMSTRPLCNASIWGRRRGKHTRGVARAHRGLDCNSSCLPLPPTHNQHFSARQEPAGLKHPSCGPVLAATYMAVKLGEATLQGELVVLGDVGRRNRHLPPTRQQVHGLVHGRGGPEHNVLVTRKCDTITRATGGVAPQHTLSAQEAHTGSQRGRAASDRHAPHTGNKPHKPTHRPKGFDERVVGLLGGGTLGRHPVPKPLLLTIQAIVRQTPTATKPKRVVEAATSAGRATTTSPPSPFGKMC